ncbi:MAG: ATP-grasp domain-containing protein [Hyphomicrobiales bacterium]|nr:ATP-grasp domain-containing protein [Hyphomicrobiales bacterium]
MIRRLLIANRAEIACRIIATARRMGITAIAVYSDPDRDARHVRIADRAVAIGGDTSASSYLNIEAVLAAAKQSKAEAVHPGYGFLSENPDFVDAVVEAGLIFVGPGAGAVRAMGRKDRAKMLMAEAGVPVVPGYHGDDRDEKTLMGEAAAIGYPVMIKARAGGGGKGMRRVDGPDGFVEALAATRREAASAFGDDNVLIEKFIAAPRHIEVQIFADSHGHVVHLYERDCTLQRRHQKVIEEAPAPGMTDEMRSAMTGAAVSAAKAIGYQGAGTVEFIVDGRNGLRPDGFWFMEMNTRLQVEHPVTEMVTGLDLVEWQIRVAAGETLPRRQDEIKISGHAVEARVYAEDPQSGFLPAPGPVYRSRFPVRLRVDHGINNPDEITPFYDPMIAKIAARGDSRSAALASLHAGLLETHILGTKTNLDFIAGLVRHDDVRSMNIDANWIDRNRDALTSVDSNDAFMTHLAAFALAACNGALAGGDGARPGEPGWRLWGAGTSFITFRRRQETIERRLVFEGRTGGEKIVRIFGDGDGITVREIREEAAGVWSFTADGNRCRLTVVAGGNQVSLVCNDRRMLVERCDPLAVTEVAADASVVTAPMTGVVTLANASVGDTVKAGDILMRMEAMKMELSLKAPCNGVVAEVHAAEGVTVDGGAVLIQIKPEAS